MMTHDVNWLDPKGLTRPMRCLQPSPASYAVTAQVFPTTDGSWAPLIKLPGWLGKHLGFLSLHIQQT